MSRANRRRQRPGSQPPNARQAGTPSSAKPPASSPGSSATTGETPAAATSPVTPTGTTTPPRLSSTARTTRPSSSGGGSARAGRRDRSRSVYQPSFLERHRTALVAVAAMAGIAVIAAFVFLSAARPAYACTNVWSPAPTASPTAGATPALGYVQPDMGRTHIAVGEFVTYTYCAPASGSHINKPGSAGPISPRVYGPGDSVVPEGWIHNLEHGGLILLYAGDGPGASADGQAQLRAFYDAFPNSPVCNIPKGVNGPVIARFDEISTPYQALVWGRVLPLETFDQAEILAFWQQWGDRTNPEPQCTVPSATPAVSASAAPSGSVGPETAAPSPS